MNNVALGVWRSALLEEVTAGIQKGFLPNRNTLYGSFSSDEAGFFLSMWMKIKMVPNNSKFETKFPGVQLHLYWYKQYLFIYITLAYGAMLEKVLPLKYFSTSAIGTKLQQVELSYLSFQSSQKILENPNLSFQQRLSGVDKVNGGFNVIIGDMDDCIRLT